MYTNMNQTFNKLLRPLTSPYMKFPRSHSLLQADQLLQSAMALLSMLLLDKRDNWILNNVEKQGKVNPNQGIYNVLKSDYFSSEVSSCKVNLLASEKKQGFEGESCQIQLEKPIKHVLRLQNVWLQWIHQPWFWYILTVTLWWKSVFTW